MKYICLLSISLCSHMLLRGGEEPSVRMTKICFKDMPRYCVDHYIGIRKIEITVLSERARELRAHGGADKELVRIAQRMFKLHNEIDSLAVILGP